MKAPSTRYSLGPSFREKHPYVQVCSIDVFRDIPQVLNYRLILALSPTFRAIRNWPRKF
jgi:hypothetical protein